MNEDVKLRDAFSHADANMDGRITMEELRTLLRSQGYDTSDSEIDEILQNVDLNGAPIESGTMDFNEFVVIIDRIEFSSSHVSDKDLVKAFRMFDAEGKGYIEAHEFREIMTSMGERLTDEEVKEMMREAYSDDADGHIHFQEFKKWLLTK